MRRRLSLHSSYAAVHCYPGCFTRAGRGRLSRVSQAAVGVLPLPPGWVLPGPPDGLCVLP